MGPLASRYGLAPDRRSIRGCWHSRRKNAYAISSGRTCWAECPAACGWLDPSAARSILGYTPKGVDASLEYVSYKCNRNTKENSI